MRSKEKIDSQDTVPSEEALLGDLLHAYLTVQRGLSSDQLQMAVKGVSSAALCAAAILLPIDEPGVLRNRLGTMAPALEQVAETVAAAPDLAVQVRPLCHYQRPS